MSGKNIELGFVEVWRTANVLQKTYDELVEKQVEFYLFIRREVLKKEIITKLHNDDLYDVIKSFKFPRQNFLKLRKDVLIKCPYGFKFNSNSNLYVREIRLLTSLSGLCPYIVLIDKEDSRYTFVEPERLESFILFGYEDKAINEVLNMYLWITENINS